MTEVREYLVYTPEQPDCVLQCDLHSCRFNSSHHCNMHVHQMWPSPPHACSPSPCCASGFGCCVAHTPAIWQMRLALGMHTIPPVCSAAHNTASTWQTSSHHKQCCTCHALAWALLVPSQACLNGTMDPLAVAHDVQLVDEKLCPGKESRFPCFSILVNMTRVIVNEAVWCHRKAVEEDVKQCLGALMFQHEAEPVAHTMRA